MRSINIRGLIILVASLAVLGGGVFLVSRHQQGRHAVAFLREADRAEGEDRPDDAARFLGMYLRLVPDDAQVSVRLGNLLADLEEWQAAFGELERVARRWPEEDGARRRLVDVAIRLGRFPDARQHIEKHLLSGEDDDVELLEQLALCRAGMGEWSAAAEILEEAVEKAPHRIDPYRLLAGLLRTRLNRPAEADAWIDRLLEENPEAAQAHIVAGQYFREFGPAERVSPHVARALELAPEEAAALLLAAQAARDAEEYEAARRFASAGIEGASELTPLYVTLADVQGRLGEAEGALETVQQGIAACGPHPDLLWNLTSLLIETGRLDEARHALGQLRAANQPETLLALAEAQIDAAAGNWRAAARTLERARPGLTEWPETLRQADNLLGTCYQRMGNTDRQLAAFRRAVNLDPLSVSARTGVISALTAAGRIEEALAEMQQLVRLQGAPASSLVDLARLMILRNLRSEGDPRRWNEVEQVLDRAAAVLPDSPQVPILRAETLVARNRVDEAEALLEAAEAALPERIEIRTARAALARQRGDWEGAAELLDAAEDALGDGPEVRLARARLLLRREEADAAAGLRRLAEVRHWPEEDRVGLWRSLAAAALQIREVDLAGELARRVLEIDPTDSRVRMFLFDAALLAVDSTGMEQALEEIRHIEGEGPLWHYGTAVLLRLTASGDDREPLARAQRHLAEARAMRPNWSRLAALAAEIFELQGEPELALERYMEAIELGERNAVGIRRVVRMLYERQRFSEADRVIRLLEEQQVPFSPELNRMAAEVSLRLEDDARTLGIIARVADEPQSYLDHIWLGQVYAILGQRALAAERGEEAAARFAEAEGEFRRAVAAAGETADSHVALVQFLGRIGELEKAEEAIARAREEVAEAQVSPAMALCYEAIGRIERAAEQYAAALAAAPGDARLARRAVDFYLRHEMEEEAGVQLARFLDGGLRATDGDLAWARRSQAMLLLAGGSRAAVDRALALIEANLASPVATLQDRRTQGLLLAAHPDRARRREARRVLEDVVAQQRPANPEDVFLLAQLYQADGDWARAAGHMRGLLGAHAAEPRYAAWYAAGLLQRGELAEADVWLRRLQAIAPQAFQTASLQAQAAFQRGRYQDVIRLFDVFVDGGDPDPHQVEMRRRLVVPMLEQYARRLRNRGEEDRALPLVERAEALLREAEDGSFDGLLLSAFLGRQGRTEEALEQIEARWNAASAAALAGALTAVASQDPEPRTWDRLQALFDRALVEHGRVLPLLFARAEALSRRGDLDAAEGVYREVLARNSEDVVALNNLAMLLAVRGQKIDEASAMIERALARAGNLPYLLDTRAVVLMAEGDFHRAIEELEQVVTVAPTATRQFHRAQALLAAGRSEEAAAALAAARDLGLSTASLHPLERPAYEEFLREMESKGAGLNDGRLRGR